MIPLPLQLPLQNRYTALHGQLENGLGNGSSYLEASPKSNQTTHCIKMSSVKNKRRAIVIGYSLLKGAEGPICRPDPLDREVCCLPVAQVKDVRKKLPSLVWPSDYYPLLLFQVGSDEVGRTLRTMKKDLRALRRLVKGSGAQVVFSSPVTGNNEGLDVMSQWINNWLSAWCHRQGFGFFDLGSIYMSPSLLTTDRNSFFSTGIKGF